MTRKFSFIYLLTTLFPAVATADVDLPTKFSNQGGIINTRHNLTQSGIGAGSVIMNPYRNNYGEICVYCHTPHGANSNISAPLWNRTRKTNTYVTYNSGTLTANVDQPGMASLTCLSCHDGTLAVDSIINMPGSGKNNSGQQTSQSNSFLNTWNNATGADASVHLGMKQGECLACHSSDAGFVGAGASDFRVAAFGTDLSNQHPVGIDLPLTRLGVDFNDPDVKGGQLAFYDGDGNGKPGPNELRFFKTGSTYRVECASCHDPHGVPSGGQNSQNFPTFLRKAPVGSALCLTCHAL